MLLACLLSLPSLAWADGDADRRAILEVEADLCRAFVERDAEALQRGLDETFTLVGSDGAVADRGQTIAEVVGGNPAYDEFCNHDHHWRFHGDTAIVIGVTSIRGRSDGEPFAARFRFTDTWLRRDDGWKLAASHASRLQGGD